MVTQHLVSELSRLSGARHVADPYAAVFRNLLFPAWETHVRRRPTLARLATLEASDRVPLEQLEGEQFAALQALLCHAEANVPWYRRAFAKVGLRADDVRTLNDLRYVPLFTRADARASSSDRVAISGPAPAIRKQTSGTTGEPMVFGYEWASETWRTAIKLRAYGWAGYHPGVRVAHFWGAPTAHAASFASRAKVMLDRTLKRETYLSCATLDDDSLGRAADVLARVRPTVLVVYAHAGAHLARFLRRTGRELPGRGTIAVITGAERLLPDERAAMQDAFGPVFETYGCREVMLIASECEAHDGLHVAMENVLLELVVRDAHGARPARPGELGEVVLTDLHNFAMPFIRYANGDVAVARAPGACACGRTLPRIASVEGRSVDTLRGSDGTPITGLAFSFLVAHLGERVRRFQIVQQADDTVRLRVIPGGPIHARDLEALRAGARKHLRGLEVEIELVNELPASAAGKHRLVIVEPRDAARARPGGAPDGSRAEITPRDAGLGTPR